MSHLYSCHVCHKFDACELYSYQLLTPAGRVGFDLYECQFCKVRYLINNGEIEFTKKTTNELFFEAYKKSIEIAIHPEKFKEEIQKEKIRHEQFKESDIYKLFRKGMEEGLKD